MSVLCVLLFFLMASSNNREVKIVFVDGPIENGTVRSIRGRIIEDTDTTITLERTNGRITIGKNFIVKIENWHNHRGRGDFDY